MADPAKTVNIYQAMPLPADWNSWNDFQKLEWLDAQPLPDEMTLSLGTLYRRAHKLSMKFHLLFKMLKIIQAKVTASKDHNVLKAFNAFIKAFNAGVGGFGNALRGDMEQLLKDGTYGKELPVLKVGPFESINLDDYNAEDVGSVWDIIRQALNMLLIEYPTLSEIKPSLAGASYADLLKAVVATGEKFFDVWNKYSANSIENWKPPAMSMMSQQSVLKGPEDHLEEDETAIVELQPILEIFEPPVASLPN